MARPFGEFRRGCAHCGSRHFERNKYGIWRFALSRFYCHDCKGKFFRPSKIAQLTEQGRSHKVSHQHRYKH